MFQHIRIINVLANDPAVQNLEGSNHLSHISIFKEQRGPNSTRSIFTPSGFTSPLKLLKNSPLFHTTNFLGGIKCNLWIYGLFKVESIPLHSLTPTTFSRLATLTSRPLETKKPPAVATDARLAIKNNINL